MLELISYLVTKTDANGTWHSLPPIRNTFGFVEKPQQVIVITHHRFVIIFYHHAAIYAALVDFRLFGSYTFAAATRKCFDL